MVTQRGKRIRRQRLGFFLACLASFVGLLVYIIGRHKIPFPHDWIPNIKHKNMEAARATKLFFVGIGIHLNVNFLLGAVLVTLLIKHPATKIVARPSWINGLNSETEHWANMRWTKKQSHRNGNKRNLCCFNDVHRMVSQCGTDSPPQFPKKSPFPLLPPVVFWILGYELALV